MSRFEEHRSDLVSFTEDRIYKYKPLINRWLTSSYTSGEIDSIYRLGDRLFVKSKSPSALYYSDNGLSWERFEHQFGPSFRVFRLDDRLIVVEPDSITVITKETVKTFSVEIVGERLDLTRAYLAETLYYLKNLDNGLLVFSLDETGLKPEIFISDCAVGEVVTRPDLAILCQDRNLWVEDDEWKRYRSVFKIQSDEESRFILKVTDDRSLIIDISDRTLELNDRLTDLIVRANRVFVRDSLLFWNEIDWDSGQVTLLELTGDLTIRGLDSIVWLIRPDGCLLSLAPRHSASCNLSGDPKILRSGDLFFAWEKGGAKVFQSGDGANFTASTSSWAASARSVELFNFNGQLFVWVLNASDRLNLHRFDRPSNSFRRVSFSSRITQSGSIGFARGLNAGDQLELEGFIGVLPGKISPNFGYLHDRTGGIQFFLTGLSSLTALPRFSKIRIVGEISPSKAKRVTVSSLAAIEDLNQISKDNFYTSLTSLEDSLGRLVVASGRIIGLSDSVLDLSADIGEVPIRGRELRDLFTLKDRVKLRGVVDYNSGSERNELFLTELEERVPEEKIAEPAAAASVSAPAIAPPSSSRAQPRVQVASSPERPAQRVNLEPTLVKEAYHSESPALPATEKPISDGFNNLALVSLALVAGYLCGNGRRFRRQDAARS